MGQEVMQTAGEDKADLSREGVLQYSKHSEFLDFAGMAASQDVCAGSD